MKSGDAPRIKVVGHMISRLRYNSYITTINDTDISQVPAFLKSSLATSSASAV